MHLTPTPLGFGPRMGGSMFRQGPFINSMNGSLKEKKLGENDQQWFSRAKAAVAQYDDLWERSQRINDSAYRNQLAEKYHPLPENASGALYRRNAVAYNVALAESQTPVNYALYQDTKQQERVAKLEEWIASFRKDVEFGEQTYGVLTAPAATTEGTPQAPSGTPSWLIPVGVGIAVLGLGALLLGGD